MAKIRPFKAIRPAKESAKQIAALPYDVYNRQEAKEIVSNNPISFLRIDRAETNFDDDVDTYDARVYKKAHDLLWEMVDKGYYIQDETPCYYIYELTMENRVQTGICALASIDDYENNIIKKHENTRAEKEEDRIRHVDVVNAQTGPIFLAYRAVKEIDEIVEKHKKKEPEYDFVSDDGIRHRIFCISEKEDIEKLHHAFSKKKEIYIADGHHRAASAVRVGQMRRKRHPSTGEEEYNYFLSVLFPDDQLMIMDYNRVVKDLNGLSEEEFIDKIEHVAYRRKESTKPIAPGEKGQFSIFLNDTWMLYEIKEEYRTDDVVDGLDVSLLQSLILEPVLNITNPKTDKRIDFVGGIRGLEELQRRCHDDCKVAFAMYPTSIGELFAVADANRLMPPKSTWFEPKLRSGLFIHGLKEEE